MSTWRKLDLGDAITAAEPLARLCAAFAPEAGTAGAAMFVRQEAAQSLHCRVTVFVSPAVGALPEWAEAVVCVRPARDGLELVAGDPACWDALFPEGGNDLA